MGFNHMKSRGIDFEELKSQLEEAIDIIDKVCDKVEEMEEEFGERDSGGMGGRGGSYNERDGYMRRDNGDFGERRGRRGR